MFPVGHFKILHFPPNLSGKINMPTGISWDSLGM